MEGQRAAAAGYVNVRRHSTSSEALLSSSYTGDTSTAGAQVSDSANMQDATRGSGAAPSVPAAVTLTDSGIAGGSDPSRPHAAPSWQLLDSCSDSAHPAVGGAQTPLGRSVFQDAGSLGAESPGSSDAEGPTGIHAAFPVEFTVHDSCPPDRLRPGCTRGWAVPSSHV